MAEEEADYGFDDEQDEWRRGSVDIVGEANEDVLSLDGNEEEGKSGFSTVRVPHWYRSNHLEDSSLMGVTLNFSQPPFTS